MVNRIIGTLGYEPLTLHRLDMNTTGGAACWGMCVCVFVGVWVWEGGGTGCLGGEAVCTRVRV
jgi:hypothetical protein